MQIVGFLMHRLKLVRQGILEVYSVDIFFRQIAKAGDFYYVKYMYSLNPFLTNGFSNHYHLGQFTYIFRGIRMILIS